LVPQLLGRWQHRALGAALLSWCTVVLARAGARHKMARAVARLRQLAVGRAFRRWAGATRGQRLAEASSLQAALEQELQRCEAEAEQKLQRRQDEMKQELQRRQAELERTRQAEAQAERSAMAARSELAVQGEAWWVCAARVPPKHAPRSLSLALSLSACVRACACARVRTLTG
jgi:ElaB/YqjD/DUF883 family membrane-anchored ribosome-binding protein